MKRKVAQGVAAGTAVAMALQPRINSAERRGVELAADLRTAVEDAILRCTRRADQEANEDLFDGRSPSPEECRERKREGQTWAMFLGDHKHRLAWPCLRAALEKLVPGRYRLEPRFRLNERTGQWECLAPEVVDQIVSLQKWTALRGSIAPDVIILDGNGFIIHVYDMKFPCPESNVALWSTYASGRWESYTQDELYKGALKVDPKLVSPAGWVNPE